MCATILQLCNLWFLLENQQKTSSFFLDFSIPTNKDEAVNKSVSGSDESILFSNN